MIRSSFRSSYFLRLRSTPYSSLFSPLITFFFVPRLSSFYIATDERNATFIAHMREEGAVFIDDLLTSEDRRSALYFQVLPATRLLTFSSCIFILQGVRCLGAGFRRRDGDSRAEFAISLFLRLRSRFIFSVSLYFILLHLGRLSMLLAELTFVLVSFRVARAAGVVHLRARNGKDPRTALLD